MVAALARKVERFQRGNCQLVTLMCIYRWARALWRRFEPSPRPRIEEYRCK